MKKYTVTSTYKDKKLKALGKNTGTFTSKKLAVKEYYYRKASLHHENVTKNW